MHNTLIIEANNQCFEEKTEAAVAEKNCSGIDSVVVSNL